MKMRFHRGLVMALGLYVVCFVISTFLFAIIYYMYSRTYDVQFPINRELSNFISWVYFSVMIFFGSVDYDAVPLPLRNISVIQYFVNSIIIPLTSGIIFYYILNRPPNMIFSEKLLIRKRSSESIEGQISLSVIIGNKDKGKVYDVQCQIIFIYYKIRLDGTVGVHADSNLVKTVPYIDNFYRFAFELEKFPSALIKGVIDKDNQTSRDRISIIVTGKFGKFGDAFMIEKEYSVSDIEIGKETKPIYIYTDLATLSRGKFNWVNINKVIHYPESEREDLVRVIRAMLHKKSQQ